MRISDSAEKTLFKITDLSKRNFTKNGYFENSVIQKILVGFRKIKKHSIEDNSGYLFCQTVSQIFSWA